MRRAAAFLVLALMVLWAAPVAAQEDPIPLRLESIDTLEHPQVTFVAGMPSQLVGKELTAENFTLLEAETSRPVEVERLSNADLEVVLTLDTSGSMKGEPLSEAKKAISAFVQQMPQGVRVAVISFGNTFEVVSPFTTDLVAIEQAVSDLRARGETAMYDGLVASVEQFSDAEASRRTVVVLTDGADTVSEADLSQAIIQLLGSEASFYAVELESPESDHASLVRLEAATSGRLVGAGDPAALHAVFDEIASELVNQYRISYISEDFGPTEVVIRAEAEGIVAEATERLQFPAPPPPPPVPVTTVPATVPVPVPVTPTTFAIPELRPGHAVTTGLFAEPWALVAGAAALFVGIAVLLGMMLRGRERPTRPPSDLMMQVDSEDTRLSGLTGRATLFAQRALERKGRGRGIDVQLEKAGIMLRSGEFAILVLSLMVLAGAVGWILGGPVVGLAAGALAVATVALVLRMRIKRRQRAFSEQLGDTLQLIGGGIRAGYGLMQAIDSVAAEAPSPTSEELHRIVVETNIGRDTVEALQAAANRVESEDFEWVVEAIQIHREVGGDLAEILDTAAATIRDRDQIRRRITTLSAEGKMSAGILITLPFLVASAMIVTNPEYLSELTTTSVGRLLIVIGMVLLVLGGLWMRRIVRLRY